MMQPVAMGRNEESGLLHSTSNNTFPVKLTIQFLWLSMTLAAGHCQQKGATKKAVSSGGQCTSEEPGG
jgi:hypothetical protein